MNFSYKLLKKFQPKLPAIQEVAEGLTRHAFEIDGIDGDVLDVDLLSNRWSDAASHIGMARECSAIFGLPFDDSKITNVALEKSGDEQVVVDVQVGDLCNRYSASLLSLPETLELPEYIPPILEDCGIQSINPVVDIMNYIMLETGQPLHAFDFEKIKSGKMTKSQAPNSELVVRKAKEGEEIETLDGETYKLKKGALVIADTAGPLAIAGIKGGERAAVTEDTKSIIVESANFDMASIAKTSQALKLRTDASARFEHAISPALVAWGMGRAVALLVELGATVEGFMDEYPRPQKKLVVPWSGKRHEQLIGAPTDVRSAQKHFEALGFGVSKKQEDVLEVHIPAWRTDIEHEEGLIEEAARLEGYRDLQAVPPADILRPAKEDAQTQADDFLRNILASFGFSEVYLSSFIGEKEYADRRLTSSLLPADWKAVELANPINKNATHLRPSLLPGIKKSLYKNSSSFEECYVFELGNIFWQEEGLINERRRLGLGIYSQGYPAIRELRGVVDALLRDVGIVEQFTKEEGGRLLIHSGETLLGELLVESLEDDAFFALAELEEEIVWELAEQEKTYKEIPKHPAVMRDISLILPDVMRVGDIVSIINESAPELVEDVDLIDEYVDEQSLRPSGRGEEPRQSITLRIVFRLAERTLTSEEVDKAMRQITNALQKQGGVNIR